ncbi:MAG: hypothetical protein LBD24_02865 [Spirochaetaceae bacterium]|jgi:hypothetical protein|nr:hypothetical protein [Spirochaetaceae bacterium]
MENNRMRGTVQKARRKSRYHSKARAYIIGLLEDAALKNISITGCCIVREKPVKLKVREMYVLHVVPEDTVRADRFELLVQCRWIHLQGNLCEVGFWIISSPMSFSKYKHLCQRH